jgi:hypothetical protein
MRWLQFQVPPPADRVGQAWLHSASMSRGEAQATNLVGDEMAIDDLRELALQAAERLARRLVLGELALVLVAPAARMHRLYPRREVKRVVERAVTTARKSVAGHLAARDLDRRRARVAREAVGGGGVNRPGFRGDPDGWVQAASMG